MSSSSSKAMNIVTAMISMIASLAGTSGVLNCWDTAIPVKMDMVNHQELIVDEYSTQLCNSNAFAITKLLAVFDSYFD